MKSLIRRLALCVILAGTAVLLSADDARAGTCPSHYTDGQQACHLTKESSNGAAGLYKCEDGTSHWWSCKAQQPIAE